MKIITPQTLADQQDQLAATLPPDTHKGWDKLLNDIANHGPRTTDHDDEEPERWDGLS